jgi:hypothetical protein
VAKNLHEMTTRATNRTAIYLIAVLIIVVAFFLLGGGTWMTGMMHGNRSLGMANWNWSQILISLTIGFLVGLLVSRRKLW